MVKSGKKYTYGVDEPGRLSIKTYERVGYLLTKRRGNTVYVFEGIQNNKPRWKKSNQHVDYDFYGHPLDKLCKFFKKINNLETFYVSYEDEVTFLELENKKEFYKELLNKKERKGVKKQSKRKK